MFNIKKSEIPDLHDNQLIEKILGNSSLKPYIESINKKADEFHILGYKPLTYNLLSLYYDTGDRSRYEEVYFTRRGYLSTFALRVWLYKKKSDIKILEDLIWSICDEYTWSLPAHMDIDKPITIDLFASETAYALSEILFMLQDYLSELVIKRGIEEVQRRVLQPFYTTEEKFPWEEMENNWCAVCAGSIGATAIYLEKNSKIRDSILKKIEPTLDNFINSFEKDGTCLEGLSYWTYGISFYVSYSDLLKQYTNGKIDLLATDKFKKIAAFQEKCYMDNGLTISISDGNRRDKYRLGLTYYLADKFKDLKIPPNDSVANFNSDPCYRWCEGIKDLIWGTIYKKEELNKRIKTPTYHILRDAQWLICKNIGSYSMVAKGGHNDEPHNHNDVGSFILYKNGEVMLTDLGAGLYTKDYFNENRYTIFCNQSASHSVPIFNGNGQKNGLIYRAENTSFENRGELNLDIGNAYDSKELKSLNRSVKIDNSGLVLQDSYTISSYPQNATERFITQLKPYIEENKVIIKGEKETLIIEPLDIKLQPEISTIKHLNHNGQTEEVYVIDFPIILSKEISSYIFTFK